MYRSEYDVKDADRHPDVPGYVEKRYQLLSGRREAQLYRSRACAAVTIPTILPPQSDTTNYKFPTPYQSIGALGVNNLASKLMMTLFPPNGLFFKFTITSFDLDNLINADAQRQASLEGNATPERILEIANERRDKIINETGESLGRVERAVVEEYNAKANMATDFEALKHLIIAGNVLRYAAMRKEDIPRIWGMDKYVVNRSPNGQVLEIIIRERISRAALPEDVLKACTENPLDADDSEQKVVNPHAGDNGFDDVLTLFTCIKRVRAGKTNRSAWKWIEYQELNGKYVPDSKSQYKDGECPYLALRWTKIDGEDYGRSYIENLLGDLISSDNLRRALIDGAAAAARLLFLTEPSSPLSAEEIAEAPNGSVLVGPPGSVAAVQVGKGGDFQTAENVAQGIDRGLSQALIVGTSVQRSGERVTAEEIRTMIGELEQGLGGSYSVLAIEYQLPLVSLTLKGMQDENRAPPLPDDVRPTILTGMNALGKNADLERLMTFLQVVTQIPDASGASQLTINWRGCADRVAGFLDIDSQGIMYSQEEVEEAIQQMREQQAQAAQQQALEAGMAQATEATQPHAGV